ncbi:MAG: methionyl-tRNA formyltransferase [Pseudomonadota bacterium]
MAGDTETGVGVMQMEAGLDTGPVMAEACLEITALDTGATLHDQLAEIGASLMIDTLTRIEAGEVTPEPQSEQGVTYAKKIEKAESRIDWTRPAREVDLLIRGLSPFPGAWFDLDGERVKVLMSRVEDGSGDSGEVLDDSLLVACGEDSVRLLRLQKAGKTATDAQVFLNGTPVAAGRLLVSGGL